MISDTALAPPIERFLLDNGLIKSAAYTARPLTGGVASDIWLVEADGASLVVKKALEALRVAQDWRAPVSRNASEVEWLRVAGGIVPSAVPKIRAHDPEIGIFAMQYFDPDLHPVWKAELMGGFVDGDFAAKVGRAIAQIHGATAALDGIAEAFDNDSTFHALRLEPYLEATARVHPDLAAPLLAQVRSVAGTKRALVHGDVSPKNILAGPTGPIFLDAECAWYGDPCFDLAFCLNHLLLKALHMPKSRDALVAAFRALASAYLGRVDWEDQAEIDRRAAALLPGLALARIDGKSPVEYITQDADKAFVRRVAGELLRAPVRTTEDVIATWESELAQHG